MDFRSHHDNCLQFDRHTKPGDLVSSRIFSIIVFDFLDHSQLQVISAVRLGFYKTGNVIWRGCTECRLCDEGNAAMHVCLARLLGDIIVKVGGMLRNFLTFIHFWIL